MNKICISKLIVPGSLISIRVGNELTWTLNIVYSCCDNGIDIPLTSDLLKSNVFANTYVSIKYKNEFFEYLIHGSISKIELCMEPFIRVQTTEIFENINCRSFPRHDVSLPATLSINNNSTHYCKISNISLGGAAFLLDKDIPSTSECEAYIFLNHNNSIYGKGVILRCSKHGLIHQFCMQFTFMDEENSNTLDSFLYSIDNSYDALRSKYLINSMA